METTTVDQIEPRAGMPKAALALLVVVGTLLLFQLGVIVTRVWADIGGGAASTAVVPELTSDRIAATAAEFRVDESGAATYSVPLYVVPGTAGVAPQLSLSYSSQGGYGPMGMGWSIGGLSSITRCRATRENGDFIVGGVPTDGTPQPVNFQSDRYCLDGQRLIPAQAGTATCPAVSGMAVTSLRTEIESFQRVCAYNLRLNTGEFYIEIPDPKFFTVERKDGSKSWYGNRDNDSTANRPDGFFNATTEGRTSEALVWAQTRFQDSTGNYIDYIYTQKPAGGTAGEQVISEVRYTGKTVLPGQTGSASAPYAKVVFNYSALPTAQWEYRYASGGQYVQSRRLDSVTVCATIACDAANQARHYVLAYGTTVSNSGRQIITSLKECRDNTAAVCMQPTTFEWSQAKHELVTASSWDPGYFGSTSKFEGFKLGDVDGDGRQDMVWLKDGSSGDSCPTEHIMVSFGELDSSGRQSFSAGIFTGCTPTELITGRGAGSWQLFDYTGDGRDDFFTAGSPNWHLYASQGRTSQPFNTYSNLIAGMPIPATATASTGMHPQLTDLNGDGLMDVVYDSGGTKIRFMERSGGTFVWGAQRTVTFASYPPPYECSPDAECAESAPALWNPNISKLVDFNGDAASDLIFEIAYTSWYNDSPPCNPNYEICEVEPKTTSTHRTAVNLPDNKRNKDSVMESGVSSYTTYHKYAYGISNITATTVEFKRLMPSMPPMGISPSGMDPQLADFNGDGLTDLFMPGKNGQGSMYAINTGTEFLPAVSIGTLPDSESAQVADVNGDGRSDVLYPIASAYDKRFVARYGQADGTLGPQASIAGGGAVACPGSSSCDPKAWAQMFADLDADGGMDYFGFNRSGSSSTNFFLSQAGTTSRMRPRDTLTAIVNGFGARTELSYAPLTNNAVYRRGTEYINTQNNTYTRDNTNWGRGAPVQDLLAPMYVVAKASSSAPQDGNPAAMASLYYRYSGARVQAGGRGYLGFREIVTYDPNQVGGYVATTTTYNQNFPFVGMPAHTVKSAFSGQTYAASSCLNGTVSNACYSMPGQAFPAVGGSWFGDSGQNWEADTDNTAATAGFAPGVQSPIHVRTSGSNEQSRDPFAGVVTSRVATAFGYGAYGNVSSTWVDTYTGESTLSGTLVTSNTYTDDATKWRLGRLTATTVTHRRPGKTDVVKTASFAYDMAGAVTGQMTQERTQPGGGVNQELIKSYTLDAYGNRTRVSTCSIDIAGCGSTAVAFNPNVATSINRYSRVVYDGQGRYPVATYEPFFSGSGTVEVPTQTVVNRNLFGDVTQAYNVNGVDSIAVAGTFGRPYYTWAETVVGSVPGTPAGGIDSTTIYRWCTGTYCPTGGKFWTRTITDGQPHQFAFYDNLGRQIAKASTSFNAGVVDKDVVVACTTYDGTGKPKRASNPFFLPGTYNGSSLVNMTGVCTDPARVWTTTTYDLLGRPTRVDAADGTASTLAYNGSQTTATDPRGNATTQVRNGAGELISVTDALGTVMSYDYTADGNQSAVTRDAGRGQIQNLFTYDARGRKIQQNDPDAGVVNFTYNALGELIAQEDAAGNRIEISLDARGRTWRKEVKRASGMAGAMASGSMSSSPEMQAAAIQAPPDCDFTPEGCYEPTPPWVVLTSPTSGQVFTAGQSVTLAANADDDDGYVVRVDFYLNGTKVGEDTTAPYSLGWTSAPGNHSIYARAVDDTGRARNSGTVSITVNNPNAAPAVSLTAPTNGQSFTAGDVVTLSATASDSDGSVARVEFYLDGAKVGEDTTSPYSLGWASTVGSHSMYARAVDNAGAATNSGTASISVINPPPPNAPPTVSLTSPTNGQSFTTGTVVTLSANASDSDGSVARVEFYLDGAKVGEDTTSPYSLGWTSTAGSHSVYAKAVDNAGVDTNSGTVSITVNNPLPLRDAVFVSQSVPTSMVVGQSYSVSVQMKNIGTATWTLTDGYKLGSQNPHDNTTWGTNRFSVSGSVAQNQTATFNATITAPATAGTYNFQWMMLDEGEAWFGATTPNVSITVTAPPPSVITGHIDGLANNGAAIVGWACSSYRNDSIDVHVYLGGAAGTGTFFKSATANLSSEPQVAAACSASGTNYRFSIALTDTERQQHAGKAIYIHGISPVGSSNDLIAGSGQFAITAPTPPPPTSAWESQTDFVYDTQPNGLGQPTSETITGTYTDWEGQSNVALNYSRGFGYDALGRNITASTTIDGVTYTQTNTIDSLGRAYRVQDASGKWQYTEFTSRGFVAAVCNGSAACGTAAVQRTQEVDAFGNVVQEIRAGTTAIPVTRSYNPLNGRQTSLCAGLSSCNLVNELYAWDNAGNLSTQTKDNRYGETFQYDALNRLTHGYLTMVDGVTTNTLVHWAEYDKLGNICARLFKGQGSGMGYAGRAGCGTNPANGSGTAGFIGAHQLNTVYAAGGNWTYQWDARGNQTVRDAPGAVNDRTIKYSLDDHAYEISTGNGKRTRYWYGPDGQRYKREDADGTKTLYLGPVEVVIQGAITKYRRNIGGVLIQTVQGTVIEDRYQFTDRLGSVIKYTDGTGAVIQSMDYDDWGQRRDYNEPTQTGVAAPTPTIGLRGYTGHEMVDGQDVVNMNARMYDPMLGRFLQADPMIQAPENAQSWNAYTYVFNNPLTLVDPTGMFSLRQALAVVIGVVAAVFGQYYITQAMYMAAFGVAVAGGFAAGYVGTGTLKGGLQGAFTAALTFGVGAAVQGANTFIQMAAQAVAGGITELLSGGKFGHGFMVAGLTAALMPGVGKIRNDIGRTLAGALVGGTISKVTGGKFANGAISGAVQGAMAGGRERRSKAAASNSEPDLVNGRKTYGPRMKSVVPEEKRQSFIREMMNAHGLTGSENTYYSETIPLSACVDQGAPMCSLGGYIFVGSDAFEYAKGDFGSMLFHESVHVEQFRRGGVWTQSSELMSETRQLEAYSRQMSPQNPFFADMTPDSWNSWSSYKMQHLEKVRILLESGK